MDGMRFLPALETYISCLLVEKTKSTNFRENEMRLRCRKDDENSFNSMFTLYSCARN